MCVPGAQGSLKRVLDTLGLEVQMTLNYRVSAGN